MSSKKTKLGETSIPRMQAMDLDDFKFNDIVLKDAMVLNTLVTYFNEGIFG